MYRRNEVEKLTGVSRKALRGYIDKGLLQPAERTKSGYLYDDRDVAAVVGIRFYQEAGFSLEEIGKLAKTDFTDKTVIFDRIAERLEEQRRRIEALISLVDSIRSDIESGEDGLGFEDSLKLLKLRSFSDYLEERIDIADWEGEFEKSIAGGLSRMAPELIKAGKCADARSADCQEHMRRAMEIFTEVISESAPESFEDSELPGLFVGMIAEIEKDENSRAILSELCGAGAGERITEAAEYYVMGSEMK